MMFMVSWSSLCAFSWPVGEISGIIKQCALEEDNIVSNPLSSKLSENVKNWLKEYKVCKKQAIIIKTSFVEVYIF